MAGIKHDQKKIRTDLMPGDAIMEISKVLTFGAAKYTKEYTLLGAIWLMIKKQPDAHSETFLTMLLDCVETVTKKILEEKIKSLPTNKEKIVETGGGKIKSTNKNLIKNTELNTNTVSTIIRYVDRMRNEDYQLKKQRTYLSNKMEFVLSVVEHLTETTSTWITTTPPDWLEAFFAEIVTKDSDCLMIAQTYLKKHLDTSQLHQLMISGPNKITISGERNWELGFNWSRVYGALQRHITLWFHGQDNDPETGLSHLAHAGCCLVFLLTFVLRNTGKDDRVKLSAEELERMSGQNY